MSTQDDDALLSGLMLDDRAGPAKRMSRDQNALMIERALDAWEAEQEQPKRGFWWLRGAAVAAVVLLALVGGASAARWFYGSMREQETAPSAARVVETQVVKVPPVAPAAPVEISEEPAVEPAPAPAPARARPVQDKSEPDDLLQRANRLRSEGLFQQAADTYAQVYERHPSSLSAYAARVAAASIQLEHLGRPQRARALFESALRSRPRGALDLEARQGLVLSLRDLGRNDDEARALRALIVTHRDSPAARRAEARLQQLDEASR